MEKDVYCHSVVYVLTSITSHGEVTDMTEIMSSLL